MTFLFDTTAPVGCPSELRLDQLFLGELPVGQEQTTRGHLEGCSGCRQRLRDIARHRQYFVASLTQLPPVRSVRRRWTHGVAVTLGATVAVMLLALVGEHRPESGTRLKGAEQRLGLFIQNHGVLRPGVDGEVVEPGDQLQFTVTMHEPRFVVLVGFDASEERSVYVQEQMPAGENVPLPSSLVLDARPGRETFLAIFCRQPFSGNRLGRTLAESLGSLPDSSCTTAHFSVVKEVP